MSKRKVILKKLNNYLDNDNSLNYCITVPLTNDYARNIIMYMVSNGMLARPVIKGVPMYTVMDYLRKSSPSKTHQALMDDEMLSHEYECSVVSEVKKEISSDWKQVFTIITKHIQSVYFSIQCLKCILAIIIIKKMKTEMKYITIGINGIRNLWILFNS